MRCYRVPVPGVILAIGNDIGTFVDFLVECRRAGTRKNDLQFLTVMSVTDRSCLQGCFTPR